jgi:hypothetical protein
MARMRFLLRSDANDIRIVWIVVMSSDDTMDGRYTMFVYTVEEF